MAHELKIYLFIYLFIIGSAFGRNFYWSNWSKNQEQVYLELVFAADHDAVIVESI